VALASALKREGLRRVYREASASTEAARNTYLDGLADAALAGFERGKTVLGTSAGGSSTSYSFFRDWSAADLIEFVDWARGNISESTTSEAIDAVPARCVRVSTDFSGVRV
jgi:hypothetical protein